VKAASSLSEAPVQLRPYQAEPARAILDSVVNGRGLTFTIMFSRQAGKNELSAWLETALLTRALASGGSGLKAAPTMIPQAKISVERLCRHLDAAGYRGLYRLADNDIRLGRARWSFRSAAPDSNVVGATADLLLEIDEAQDVDPDKFNKDFRPMASSTNATTVLYGTAWSDDTLLAQTIAANLDAERRDGLRRHFEVPWQAVQVPAYRRFVEAERDRLGPTHPLFITQYELQTLPGQGRLLSPAHLAMLAGDHARQIRPDPTETYVAGLDVAGEGSQGAARPDATVLAVARLQTPRQTHGEPRGVTEIQVVQAYHHVGAPHASLYPELAAVLKSWRIRHVAVDSTAMGEAAAHLLATALGRHRVTAYRFTEASKSHLGYQLQAAAASGRLKLWLDDQAPDTREMWAQLAACRATYKPNRMLAWAVPATEGHDDYAAALALLVEAANTVQPAVARGKLPT